jgi:hypothetical protein
VKKSKHGANCHPEAAGAPSERSERDARRTLKDLQWQRLWQEQRILNYYFRKTSSGATILSGFAEKFSDVGVSRSEDRSDEGLALFREAVACCLLDFLDEAVSAKNAYLSADLRGEASLLDRVVGTGRVEPTADVAIAEAGDCELTSSDGFEQSKVVGISKTESTNASAVAGHRFRDGIEDLGAWRGIARFGESIEVGVIGSL